eukprot:CAMPEP_0114258902 /NCGR_PEP_ID=MMETSP0058-20121206/19594_1 /TAXON_ID=36894 /ORGANISM="Pyramimonas parkeae, CCMP726" /LENGTH=137 /DNA_ID=CAMNT_0001373887 /DNA_START=113 /DNA_END=527 /DNA_ORIENTATION=-
MCGAGDGAQLRGHSACQPIEAKVHPRDAVEGGQLRRQGARQLVDVKPHVREAGKGAQLRWQGARQRVATKVQARDDAGAAIHLWYAEVSLILPAEVLTTKSNITIIGAAIVLRVLMEQPGLSCILNKLSERGSVRLG